MQCGQCGTSNAANRRFCGSCGAALAAACPRCGFVNEPGITFCGGCGVALGAAGARNVSPERRLVAVLFADLVGFTALTAEIGAEEVQALLDTFFSVADQLVEAHGGTIDKHIGDCVMALFGAPVARGDDVVRAVRAAAAIVAAMPGVSATVGRKLEVHGGIAAGEVVAAGGGQIGYTVTGETVNLAARLADIAAPGEILLSDGVRLVLGETVRLEPLGEVALQGFARTQLAHRLVGLAEPASLGGLLVGRDAELAQLDWLLGRVGAARQGGLVVIRGDAGVGKTRLVRELERRAAGRGVRAFSAQVLDFGALEDQEALPVLARKLLSNDARGPGLSDEVVARAAEAAAIDPASRPFLLSLLGLPMPDAGRRIIGATAVGERLSRRRQAFVELARLSGERYPLLLIVEDVHWADENTLADLAGACRGLADLPVLLVLTTRPEGDPVASTWRLRAGSPRAAVIELGPLREAEAHRLAAMLLEGSRQEAVERCVARAQGNPLFLEQLARHLRERHDDSVPVSVQTLIQARLDRLDSVDREALRAASVLGQLLSLEALRAVLERPSYDPATLVQRLFLRTVPEGLLFAHALIRDGVYDLLLRAQLRELHRRAAMFFAGRDAVLHARHLDLAGDAAAAGAYATAARQQAAAYRNDMAAELAARGLALALVPEERLDLACLSGQFQLDLGRAEQARQSFVGALALAASDADRCRALIGIAEAMRLSDQLDQALAELALAEGAATTLGQPELLASIHHLRGNLLFPLGRVDECVAQHMAALTYARQSGSSDLEAKALGGLADGEYMRGRMVSAHRAFARCCELAREHGQARVEAANLGMVGFTRYLLLDLDQAMRDAEAAVELAERTGHRRAAIVAHHTAALCALMWLDLGRAEASAHAAADLTTSIGARRFEAENMLWLAEIRLLEGDRPAALELAQAALAVGRQTAIGFFGPAILGFIGWSSSTAAERRAALDEGEALLARGAVSHNHLIFRRYAIEAALEAEDWDAVLRHADRLSGYTAAEPLPWADLVIARGRALAAHGASVGARREVTAELVRLRSTVTDSRLMAFLPALDAALAQPAP
jgi:class 3 adenylate cyclase/tetratricopeptide (TPR) repeat protein